MIISWNTTRRCNLRCSHCYRDAGEQSPRELTTSEAKGLIAQAARAGFRLLILSGGEPLLRDDLEELVEFARETGLRPVLGTNGTLIDPPRAERLKKAGLAGAAVSLDSISPGKHDALRGCPGSFQAAVDGIRALTHVGIGVQLNTTVFRWNVQELPEIIRLAEELGAKSQHVLFLVPTGRAKAAGSGFPSNQEYEEAIRKALEMQSKTSLEIKPTCAPQFTRLAREMGLKTRYTRGCLAGISYCLVGPEGDVQPCAYLPISVGNVREMSLDRIWSESPVFARLREMRYTGSCGKCSYKRICGGCRARAYEIGGDYLGPDPMCTYQGGSGSG